MSRCAGALPSGFKGEVNHRDNCNRCHVLSNYVPDYLFIHYMDYNGITAIPGGTFLQIRNRDFEGLSNSSKLAGVNLWLDSEAA